MGLFNMFGKKQKNNVKGKSEIGFDEEVSRLSTEINNNIKKIEQEQNQIVDDLSGRIEHFNNSPGHVRSVEVARKEMENLLAEINAKKTSEEPKPVSYIDELNMQVKSFNEKLPQYNQLKKLLEDRKNGIESSPELSKRLDAIVRRCDTKYPGFRADELLVPYMMERLALGIAEKDELIAVSNYDSNDMLNGYSEGERAKKTYDSVIMNAVLFDLKGAEFDNFCRSFEMLLPRLYNTMEAHNISASDTQSKAAKR